MFSIQLDIMQTLILAIVLYLLGGVIKNRFSLFNKFCIPSPVIGGLMFCILTLFLNIFNICSVSMDTTLMPYFMTFFFTIIGLGVSLSLVKKGGKLLFTYWILCGILAYCQNTLTIILSKSLHINPLLGLMCGTISMEGGHGCAAAFGATIESLGVSGACSVGIASATFGLILGGVIGGPIAKFLIEKYKLKPSHTNTSLSSNTANKNRSTSSFNLSALSFFEQILIILLAMSLGDFLTNLIYKSTNIILPSVVCCMFVAVIFRNLNEKVQFVKLDFKLLDFLNEVSLGMFLTMALMSIDLYKLSSLFGPIIVLVLCQVLFIVTFALLICFKALGKDFDAAIMISGLIGHGLGATPNALANMSSVSQKYGYSEKAFLVVPLVGAFLLDLFTMPCIILFINLLS
ncbi:sodium/glutamate symporter [Romboutsia weinsteinii]|uniref:Sodium/glutamate symporter n=1 Tax=Romboutsia weinsteinii TaxID=2020949 RepID=A0A371J488_9FIRM|nr:sodium/glutamate symporter [Romboutsia weinsteinii]RDY27555.1 sodium/glutamate symporter [Romboutsia weinsteinii]